MLVSAWQTLHTHEQVRLSSADPAAAGEAANAVLTSIGWGYITAVGNDGSIISNFGPPVGPPTAPPVSMAAAPAAPASTAPVGKSLVGGAAETSHALLQTLGTEAICRWLGFVAKFELCVTSGMQLLHSCWSLRRVHALCMAGNLGTPAMTGGAGAGGAAAGLPQASCRPMPLAHDARPLHLLPLQLLCMSGTVHTQPGRLLRMVGRA